MDVRDDLPEAPTYVGLSHAQRAVWLDLTLREGSGTYLLGRVVHLDGELDPALAAQATALLVSRHQALRLRVDAQLPRQWVAAAGPGLFALFDLREHDDPGQALADHVARRFAQTMPLGDAPLFSLDLLVLGEAHSALVLRCHHLIADEAAVAITMQHWIEIYNALQAGTAVDLAAPSLYLPVVTADQEYEAGPRHAQDLAYWTARFRSVPAPLFERGERRGGLTAGQSVSHDWQVAPAVATRLRALAEGSGGSVQAVLYALLGATLARRYRRDDFCVGLALHRRDLRSRQVVGMLAGVIPLRFKANPTDTLQRLIKRCGEQLLQDLGHHRLPVDALTRALGVSQEGLFDVALSYLPFDSAGQTPAAIDGVEVRTETVSTLEASPLSLHVADGGAGQPLTMSWSADPGVLGAADLERLAVLYDRVLAKALAAPSTAFETLPALTTAEREQLLEAWNPPSRPFPDHTLPALVAASCARQPDALAVTGDGRSFSYAGLHAASDALASTLIQHGCNFQQPVGVLLERSPESVVALLAILQCAAVYLPLDPAYPADRLAFMIADAGASRVITTRALAARLPASVEVLCIDDLPDGSATAAAPGADSLARRAALLTPDHTAYLIYTSGSTGQPKGVAVPHRAAVNLAFARLDHDPIGSGDRILAAISVGFDVSIGQLLLPLLNGASIVVAPELRTLSAREFWSLLIDQQVTHINSVPSFIDSILDEAPPSVPLLRLMLGGEALSASLVRRIHARLPKVQVVNMYGPTEACIDATCYTASGRESESMLPIGRPLPNYRAYILDAALDPVGIGVTGELYLGGPGLAIGYLGRPALTAERFIADPFGHPGQRLYRTGDRARWREDGQIEFLGRADTQVKIRGHRIEPGEIESVLREVLAIDQLAVVAQGKPGSPARLVAYVVADPDALPPPAQWRASLAQRLPDYMIPQALQPIPALPLTTNGKLDLRALPDIDEGRATMAKEAPRTPLEAALLEAWQAVLERRDIGIHDDFFELGGQSLAAIRLISLCSRACGHELPVRLLFERPTIALLAAAAQSPAALGAASRVVSLRAGGDRPPLFCIHPAGGHAFCFAPLTRALDPGQPVYGLQARGLEPGETPADSIAAMASEYLAAIAPLQGHAPVQLVGMSSGGLIAFEMARQLQAAGGQVGLLALLDTTLPVGVPVDADPDPAELCAAIAEDFGWSDLLEQLPRPWSAAALMEQVLQSGRLPEGLDAATATRIAAVYASMLRARAAWQPQRWEGNLCLVRALRRPEREGMSIDWAPLVAGRLSLADLDCGHAEVVSPEMAQPLAALLAPRLAATIAAGAAGAPSQHQESNHEQ